MQVRWQRSRETENNKPLNGFKPITNTRKVIVKLYMNGCKTLFAYYSRS